MLKNAKKISMATLAAFLLSLPLAGAALAAPGGGADGGHGQKQEMSKDKGSKGGQKGEPKGGQQGERKGGPGGGQQGGPQGGPGGGPQGGPQGGPGGGQQNKINLF